VSAAEPASPRAVPPGPLLPRSQLMVGPLLAEGGEGKVYELVGRPDQVYKAYRVPPPVRPLTGLVDWCAALAQDAPTLAARVRASTSWPLAVVAGAGATRSAGTAAGLLLPKAPRRYRLRHRDGQSHLATLSYLTADPAQRTASYGITLPPAMSPDRFGLVYALARLLEAFEWASPAMGHGDLSAKNVLWSLTRGPEVFVLDCDNGEPFPDPGLVGPTAGSAGRRRAMTPNWDDPAVPAGSNPGRMSDRYSLALIFLRVVGAAHFPIQKRQKEGEDIVLDVDVPGPARRLATLGPEAPVWSLCSSGLSATDPAGRPSASAWVDALREIIIELGATRIIDAVGAAQGRAPLPAPAPAPALRPGLRTTGLQTTGPVVSGALGAAGRPTGGPSQGSVTVRPVTAAIRTRRQVRRAPLAVGAPSGPAAAVAAPAAPPPPTWSTTRTRTGGIVTTGQTTAGGVPAAATGRAVSRPVPTVPWRTQVRRAVGVFLRWLVAEHRRTLRYLRTPGRRARGMIRLPWCAAIDFLVAALSLFVVAMIVSPFLGV
jgi:hypothetical protein